MLQRLVIENFALLKHVDLSFCAHFNVLSGETGAGKSIIIDAVKLILGERANVADIRFGEDHARVEAEFSLAEGHPVLAAVDDLGIESLGTSLILTREVRASGKNVCRINRQMVTLSQFKGICSQLVSIYGQHDYDDLGDAANRLALLDDMGDEAHRALLRQVGEAYQQAQKSGKRMKRAMKEAAQLEKEMQTLQAYVEELEPLQIKKGEEDALSARFKQAAHAQDLYQAAYSASGALYESQSSVHEMMTDVIENLKAVSAYDPQIKEYLKELESARIAIDETARELEIYRENIDFDPHEVEMMNDRLALFTKLRKKYQMSPDALVDALAGWQQKIDTFSKMDGDIEELRKAYQRDRKNYMSLSQALHDSREKLGAVFSQRLVEELVDMAMQDVKFEVCFEEFSGDQTGTD
ncbi:MAG: AAA family ATPase, partial [Peptococcaceae bacterium]|nr:AAA family ATPase [Peptococcaceae bacterium]